MRPYFYTSYYRSVENCEKNIGEVNSAIARLKHEQESKQKSFEKMEYDQISKKKLEIENIMKALASGCFADNYELCNARLVELRKELNGLEDQECPVVPDAKIRSWLVDVKESQHAPKTFIEKIVIKKTEAIIYSTFASVVGNIGCGEVFAILPTTLLESKYNSLKSPKMPKIQRPKSSI